MPAAAVVGGGGGVVGGGTIIIGGGGAAATELQPTEKAGASEAPVVDTEAIAAVSSSVTTMAGGTVVTPVPQVNPELEEATSNYVDELKNLTEMLHRVSEQSERLSRDSEEMENLNRTLTGICKIYEMQLKGASQQIGTIDEINEQTKRMADQIAELNQIYARMIEAMTVNMPKV
jgi:DNA repair ATPase RecN